MQAGTSAEPGRNLVGSEVHDQLLGWALLVVAVLLAAGGAIIWLAPGFLSVLDSADVYDWWQTSAGSLAVGAVRVVLALTCLVTGLLLLGRRRWNVNPAAFAATTGTCAVLALVVGEVVYAVAVLGGAGALLAFLRRRPSRATTNS